MKIRTILLSLALLAGSSGAALADDACHVLEAEYDHYSKVQALYDLRTHSLLEHPFQGQSDAHQVNPYVEQRILIVAIMGFRDCDTWIGDALQPSTSATGYEKAAQACYDAGGYAYTDFDEMKKAHPACDLAQWKHD